MKEIRRKLLKVIARFNNQGSAFVDLAVKIGIGVVVGSIVVNFLNTNLDSVLTHLFDKIEEFISISAS